MMMMLPLLLPAANHCLCYLANHIVSKNQETIENILFLHPIVKQVPYHLKTAKQVPCAHVVVAIDDHDDDDDDDDDAAATRCSRCYRCRR